MSINGVSPSFQSFRPPTCRKSVNNLFFYFLEIYFILFYFILLVLYFWEESYWDCANGVSFLL